MGAMKDWATGTGWEQSAVGMYAKGLRQVGQ